MKLLRKTSGLNLQRLWELYFNEPTIEKRNILVEQNLHLVRSYLGKRRGADSAKEQADMFQEGVIGLVRAVELFNPHHGAEFATYAMHWIRLKIQRYVRNSSLIHIPHYKWDEQRSLEILQEKFVHVFGRNPENWELTGLLGCSGVEIEELIRLDTLSNPLLCDEPSEERNKSEKAWADAFIDKSQEDALSFATRHYIRSEFVTAMKQVLKPRNAGILLLYCNNFTYAEISSFYGISRQAVRQVIVTSTRRLQRYFELKAASLPVSEQSCGIRLTNKQLICAQQIWSQLSTDYQKIDLEILAEKLALTVEASRHIVSKLAEKGVIRQSSQSDCSYARGSSCVFVIRRENHWLSYPQLFDLNAVVQVKQEDGLKVS